jgi:hypothetical protein
LVCAWRRITCCSHKQAVIHALAPGARRRAALG